VDSTLAPPRGTTWGDVTATANPRKFIVATSPRTRANWNPTRLYTLTLSAGGAVTRLNPLPAGSLPVQLGGLAADADGGVIAFSGQRSGGAFVVGALIGNQVKQWSVSEKEAFTGSVSVTSAGDKIAFVTQYNGPGSHFAAMVLATSSAPGSLLTRAKTVGSYDYPRKDLYMFSVAISPDGTRVYVVTRPINPLGGAKLPTTLTAYSASRRGAPVTITTWTGGEPALLPIGGRLFAWMYAMPSSASAPSAASTAYLINPATRTKMAVRLPGLPSGRFASLAW
jgi:DNA-binding beta-propeller fold protein YncE